MDFELFVNGTIMPKKLNLTLPLRKITLLEEAMDVSGPPCNFALSLIETSARSFP